MEADISQADLNQMIAIIKSAEERFDVRLAQTISRLDQLNTALTDHPEKLNFANHHLPKIPLIVSSLSLEQRREGVRFHIERQEHHGWNKHNSASNPDFDTWPKTLSVRL